MSGTTVALLGFAAMLAMIALRCPIGLSMLLVGSGGYVWLHPSGMTAFFGYMKTNPYHQFANYTLSVIPLFILMGALAERAGIASALFKAAERALGRYRGGHAMAVIGACTAFGAVCGSAVATTATFGRAAACSSGLITGRGALASSTTRGAAGIAVAVGAATPCAVVAADTVGRASARTSGRSSGRATRGSTRATDGSGAGL